MQSESHDSVMISDLSIARPKSALAEMPKPGCWYSMSYELTDGVKGVMLTADPYLKAAEIEIPLDVSGVYRIYVGLNYFMRPYKANSYGSLWVKLSGDRGFSKVGLEGYSRSGAEENPDGRYRTKVLGRNMLVWQGKPMEAQDSYNMVYETYLRTADLTGKSLMVSTPKPPYDGDYYRDLTNISFIRLEPATAEDLELMTKLKPRDETRNLMAIWCAGALTGHTSGHRMYHPENSQWFVDEFEPYRDSDFGIFCMEAIRGNVCLFKTKHGDVGTWDRSWDESWVDPLTEFTRVAHDDGMKMFVSMRMIGGGRPNAFYPINWARFFWNNLQWAKRSKEGMPCSNVSLAYEGARKHWLALLREALDHGIDGIVLYFNRSQPFVMYEEPAVDSFMKKHGIDPRTLPQDDERWEKHVAGYVTQFVREVRALLDEKPGRELGIIFRGIEGFKPGVVMDGCDPDTWIEEGLVDYLFFNLHLFDRGIDYGGTPKYIRYWKELSKGRVKVYPSLMPRQQPGEEYARLARWFYDKGADGFCVWDSEGRAKRISEWNVLKHLGHREQLEYFEQKAPDYYRFNQIKIHRGLDVRYSYTEG